MPEPLRTFDGGAVRDSDASKLDFEGYLSPRVLWAFGEYMHKHQTLADGSRRGSDNWQGGMPLDVYMKSLIRHVFDLWLMHRGGTVIRPENGQEATLPDTLGGIMFNLQGYWHESLKKADARADFETQWLDGGHSVASHAGPPSPVMPATSPDAIKAAMAALVNVAPPQTMQSRRDVRP